MMIIDWAIAIFIVLEFANVLILYFNPSFSQGNSLAPFKPWEAAKVDENQHLFQRYLARWVANCKLIFIVLFLVILLVGTPQIKLYAVGGSLVAIGVYFLTLHPLIRKLDQNGALSPQGYSKTLGWMIGGFMLLFFLALIVQVTLTSPQ